MINYFLDTSILIPFFGMEINIKNIEKSFKDILELTECKFGYSDVSLIEIRFLIERSIRRGFSEELRIEYTNGLLALMQSEKFQNFAITDLDISNLEIKFLINYNFTDYFDRMIMATSYYNSPYLVTMDNKIKSTMKEFIRNDKTRKSSQFIKVISWSEMLKYLKLHQ